MSPLDLPRWTYVLGKTAQPDHETLARAKTLVPERYHDNVPSSDPAIRYGLTLNDAGFFWESHEVLEAVWTVAPQGGCDRILLRACIQIANANLKQAMGRERAARRLMQESLDELRELEVRRTLADPSSFAARFAVGKLSAEL